VGFRLVELLRSVHIIHLISPHLTSSQPTSFTQCTAFGRSHGELGRRCKATQFTLMQSQRSQFCEKSHWVDK